MRTQLSRTAGVTALALVRFFPAPALAQSADSVRARTLPPTVVTAARVAVQAPNVATDVVTAAELRALGAPNVSDALREIAGVQVVQTGSFGGQTSLYLRGGQSGYTRVLVDGVPVNDPGGDIDLSWLSSEDVDHIEIARGPASVLYGSDAVSGVIQIFTTHRGAGSSSHAAISAGGFDTFDARATVVSGDTSHSLVISAQRYTTAGTYAFNDGYTRNDVTASIALPGMSALGEARSHFLLKYSDAVTHIPTDGSGMVRDRNAFQFTPRVIAAAQSSGNIGGFHTAFSLSTTLSNGGYDNAPDSPTDTLGFFASRSSDEIARRTIDAYGARALAGVTLLIGATVEDETQHSVTHSDSQLGASDGTLDAYRSTRAAYASVNGSTHGRSWNAGTRIDDNSAFGQFLTYRVGASQAIGVARLRASVGTAFREPTFTENFATGFARGNPHLAPEHTTSAEAGVDIGWSTARTRLSTTVFTQHFRDLVEYTFTTATPTDPNFENLAVARANGVEVSARASPVRRVALNATATRLFTHVDRAGFDSSAAGFYPQGGRLLRRAGSTGSLSATYELPRDGSVMARWLVIGARDDIDYANSARVTLPPVGTIDASARIGVMSLLTTNAKLVARAFNLTNVRYEAVKGFPAPGRLVMIGLEIER